MNVKRLRVRNMSRRDGVQVVQIDDYADFGAVAEWSGGKLTITSDDVYITLPPIDGVRDDDRIVSGGECLVKQRGYGNSVMIVDPGVVEAFFYETSVSEYAGDEAS